MGKERYYFLIGVFLLFILESADTATAQSAIRTEEIFFKDTFQRAYPLNFENDKLCKKIGRGFGYSFLLNGTLGIFLVLAPADITMWGREDKFHPDVMKQQYIYSFTRPPVFDKDLFMVNYVGHPYQGSFYYNSLRSQGANWWQSSLFCTAQSVIWEYGIEGGMEQPSIQDLIVTPVLGTIVGELSYRAAIKMSRNGFNWYEKVATCIINPAYVINNGFKRHSVSIK